MIDQLKVSSINTNKTGSRLVEKVQDMALESSHSELFRSLYYWSKCYV